MFGDSSLEACGGYSIPLRFWLHLQFPASVKLRTLLYKNNNKDKTPISINALKLFTVFRNYCTARVMMSQEKLTDDPHPVVLNVTDNTSALNLTLHTSNESLVGRALARFFVACSSGPHSISTPSGLAQMRMRSQTRSHKSQRKSSNPHPISLMITKTSNRTSRN